MASKKDLQDELKSHYGINKNISDALSLQECQDMMTLLESESSAARLVEAFISKNVELGNNNKRIGQQRAQAEKKLDATQKEYNDLQISIKQIENSNLGLVERKKAIEEATKALEVEIKTLTERSQSLEKIVTTLKSEKQELVTVNDELKKDNKRLKNLVDAIRLKFSKDVNKLLQYDDSEIRKALVKMYKSTLG
jgi:chromosome segregation ATPase